MNEAKTELTTGIVSTPSGGSAALDKRIRKAVEADFQQWMIDSLTPDRGYLTPIDNVRALIRELVPPNNDSTQTR